MKQLWPPTMAERRKEEIAFMREFMEEGGEVNGNGIDYGANFGEYDVD